MNWTLKNALLTAGLAAAILTGARADDGPPAPPPGEAGPPPAGRPAMGRQGGMERRMQHLTEALGLTAEQQQQIAAVFAASGQQRQAIMAAALAEEDRRTKLRALMADAQARFRALLTPDQQKKLDAMPHEGRGRWGPKGSVGEGAPAPAAPAPAPGTP